MSTRERFCAVRTIRPHTTRSSEAIATCAITSACRILSLPASVVPPRDPNPKTANLRPLGVSSWVNEAEDERAPAATMQCGEHEYHRSEPRTHAGERRRRIAGEKSDRNIREHEPQRSTEEDQHVLSVSDCAMRCLRSAPRALRMTSLVGATRRERRAGSRRSRMRSSRTSATVAHRVQIVRRTALATTSSAYGCTSGRMPAPASVSGVRKSASEETRGSSVTSSRSACSGVAPGRSRAIDGV